MKLQSFRAPTMALALQQVKVTMGHNAVIMHTRTFEVRLWMGLRRREMVEVTAGIAPPGAGRRRTPQPPMSAGGGPTPGDSVAGILAAVAAAQGITPKPPANGKPSPGGSVAGLSLYTAGSKTPPKQPHPPAVVSVPSGPIDPIANGKSFLETPAATGAMIRGVDDKVKALTAVIEKMVAENRQRATPNVPDELFDYYDNLIQNQVAAEIAQDVIRALHRELRPDQLAQPHCVRERLAEHIERLIPACPPIARKASGRPHVLALVGPTGVGKTTTLAKLAANLKVKDGHKVGLITLDTYRIAAVDQLRRYSEIIGAPLRVVSCADELRSAVAGMSNMDFVLVDTAGRSPKDAARLDELRELLAAIDPDDVHLVLSSTSDQNSVLLAHDRFSSVRVDKMIFTKLDEASHVGIVLNVCHKVGKALSYVTTGQDVPNDIEVGRGRVLARMILQGTVNALPAAAAQPQLAASASSSAVSQQGNTGW